MSESLLRHKHDRMFAHLNTGGERHLDEQAFVAVVPQMCAAFGWAEDSPQAKRLRVTMERTWHQLFEPVAVDGRADPDRFSARILKWAADDTESLRDFFGPAAHAFIAMSDLDGDGYITEDEYARAGMVLRLRQADCREAFRHLDRDGDGYISIDEQRDNVIEFFTSSDPRAPGNWITGPLDHPEMTR